MTDLLRKTETRESSPANAPAERTSVEKRSTGQSAEPRRRRLSVRHLLFALAGLISVAIFVDALAISCSYNPTPTNPSGGGPGSSYPHFRGPAGYTNPIGAAGPQSS